MYSYSLSKFCQSDVGGSCANKRQSKLRKFTAHPPGILVIDIIGPNMFNSLHAHTHVEAARKWCKFMRESCELLVFNVPLYFLQSCALIKLVHVRVFTKARRPSWIGKTSNATSNYPLPISQSPLQYILCVCALQIEEVRLWQLPDFPVSFS